MSVDNGGHPDYPVIKSELYMHAATCVRSNALTKLYR